MKNSPIQRSLRRLRDDGWLCAVVERYNPFAKVHQDLFGFADILAVKGDTVLLVETTTGDHAAARLVKIKATQAAEIWLASPTRKIMVHGWRRPSGRRRTWTCRELPVRISAAGSAGNRKNKAPAAETRSPAAGFPVAIAMAKALEGPLPCEVLAKQFAAPPGPAGAALTGAAADAIFFGGADFPI